MSQKATRTGESVEKTNDVVLLAAGVKKYYPITGGVFKRHIGDVKAVDGVNLRITRGQTVGLVGESGCGKSTLARVLADLHEPTAGELYYNVPSDVADELEVLGNRTERSLTAAERERLGELRDRFGVHSLSGQEYTKFRRNVQFVFQNIGSSLNPRRMIGDIVARPLKIHTDSSERERTERVIQLLQRVDLGEDYLTRYPHELSGGQRQRVAIAQSIAMNPEVIILDEPTSALDVSVQAQILNLLQELQDDLGLAYLVITHDLGVVHHIASHVGVMYLGKIVERGDRDGVFTRTKHPYTETLLSAIPDASEDRILVEGEVPDPENPPTGCRFHTRCPKVESFCGWSGRDLTALLADIEEGDDAVAELTGKLEKVESDGYVTEFHFESSIDSDRVKTILGGDREAIYEHQPELFDAIVEITTNGQIARVEFEEIVEPELEPDESDHEVACHLYDRL